MVKIVVEKLLCEELAYVRAIAAAREGPHVVHKEAQGPGTFNDEIGGGGPRAPLPRPQDVVGGRWKLEMGPAPKNTLLDRAGERNAEN